MSHATTATAHDTHGHDAHGHGHHDPNLAHHFDTMEQQYDSGKLGMWIFLGTELLMFGGLFCAYSVYRANHPEVFIYSHTYLNTMLGAVNTAILLASSLTMAWAVRAAQMAWNKGVVWLCLATLLGGAGFMVIKAIEYNSKFEHHLAPGKYNQYNTGYVGTTDAPGMNNPAGQKLLNEEHAAKLPVELKPTGIASTPAQPYAFLDPNSGTGDAAKIVPHYNTGSELAAGQTLATTDHAKPDAAHGEHAQSSDHQGAAHGAMPFIDLESALSQQRVNTFFGIYYCMTGLHGVHVLVGMGLIIWIAYRAGNTFEKKWLLPLIPLFIGGYLSFIYAISHEQAFLYFGIPVVTIGAIWLVVGVVTGIAKPITDHGAFTPTYFAPVDLVGLYWHIVDLIWIFLFPLLYLIHGKVGS